MAEITTGGDGTEDGRPAASTPYGNPFSYGAQPPQPDTASAVPQSAPAAGHERGARATVAGLVAAGLLVGALAATALQTGGSASAAGSTPAATTAQAPGSGQANGSTGTGGIGGGAFGSGRSGRGAIAGETHVMGTVSKVASGSVTVTSQDGTTATYTVTDRTQIAEDGAEAALSDLHAGDTVLLHVLSGGVAERILAGDLGFGGPTGQLPDGTSQAPQTGTQTAPTRVGTQT